MLGPKSIFLNLHNNQPYFFVVILHTGHVHIQPLLRLLMVSKYVKEIMQNRTG